VSERKFTWKDLLTLVVLGLGLWWWFAPATPEAPEDKMAREVQEKLCRSDLDCWASKWQSRAGLDCRRPIELLAKNNFQWTDGFSEPKLPRAQWLSKDGGTLRFYGSAIKFQNGFGAWIIHTYECDYDPASRTVLAVNAYPGQL
jgi:hypothetical protein